MTHSSESFPISSNSRTKLSAFRFHDQPEKSPEKSPSKIQGQPGHADKENQASWVNGALGLLQPKPGMGDLSNQAKECPQTPANRIPLADLISSTEDAVIQDPATELTPEDHVIWQHVPASSNTDAKSQTPATNHKKRRHSSSPTFSPSTEGSKSARKEPFDLQSFQALLKTPQTDIAADLWNNYVEKHRANGNGDMQLPRLESLLASSPQTPVSAKASRDSSGLRRSISCNAEWPTSRAKRRKIDGDGSKTPRRLFSRTTSNVLDSGKPKSSRINHLVEQIEKSLQKPSAGPPSSSPVPENKDGVQSPSSSPIESRALRASEKCHHPVDERSEPCKNQVGVHGSSSEFEDEDLDQDLLDFAAASMDPFVDTNRSHNITESTDCVGEAFALKGHQQVSQGPEYTNADAVPPNSKNSTINQNNTSDIDELEDDYDGEGMEKMAAQYDKLPEPNPIGAVENEQLVPKPNPLDGTKDVIGPEKTQETSWSDEFDDDDFDLEAIEQSMNQSNVDGSDHVCRS